MGFKGWVNSVREDREMRKERKRTWKQMAQAGAAGGLIASAVHGGALLNAHESVEQDRNALLKLENLPATIDEGIALRREGKEVVLEAEVAEHEHQESESLKHVMEGVGAVVVLGTVAKALSRSIKKDETSEPTRDR